MERAASDGTFTGSTRFTWVFRVSWASVFDLAVLLCHVCALQEASFGNERNRHTRHSPMTQPASQARGVEEVAAQEVWFSRLPPLMTCTGRRRKRGGRRRRGTTPTLFALLSLAFKGPGHCHVGFPSSGVAWPRCAPSCSRRLLQVRGGKLGAMSRSVHRANRIVHRLRTKNHEVTCLFSSPHITQCSGRAPAELCAYDKKVGRDRA